MYIIFYHCTSAQIVINGIIYSTLILASRRPTLLFMSRDLPAYFDVLACSPCCYTGNGKFLYVVHIIIVSIKSIM